MSRHSSPHRIGLPSVLALTLALLPAPSQAAEPPPDVTPAAPTAQPSVALLGSGIALMLLGTGAAVGAVSYALGRDSHEEPLPLTVAGDAGLSGGDLAIITGAGLLGAGLGVALTVLALGPGSSEADSATAPEAEASLLLGPAWVGLTVSF